MSTLHLEQPSIQHSQITDKWLPTEPSLLQETSQSAEVLYEMNTSQTRQQEFKKNKGQAKVPEILVDELTESN